MDTKICTKCLLELPLSNYSKRKVRCKKCMAEDKADYLRRNPNQRHEYYLVYKHTAKYKLGKLNAKHRRRQLTKNIDGTVTQEALDTMLENQSCLCNICNKDITLRSDRHLDHVYPLSRGGLHTILNLQWLCVKCNMSKRDKIPLTN